MTGALGYPRLAASSGIAAVEMGGHRPDQAIAAARGIATVVEDAQFGIILDRDFRCSAEISSIRSKLENFRFVTTLGRKEIENYLLDPPILDTAIQAAVADRQQRGGKIKKSPASAADILMRATDPMRIDTQSQYVESWIEYERGIRSAKNARTINREATEWFEGLWATIEGRVQIVPGKDALRSINNLLQDEVGIALSAGTIAETLTTRSVGNELKELLRTLDNFRSKD